MSTLGPADLPPELATTLRDELEPGEQLVWSAQPNPSALGRAMYPWGWSGWLFFGFAALWTCGATAMIIIGNRAGWSSQGKPANPPPLAFQLFFPAVGLIFMGVGLVIAWLPRRAGRAAAHTAYALTSHRIILVEGTRKGDSRNIIRYRTVDFDRVQRSERTDGTGNLIFEFVDLGYMMNGKQARRPRGIIGVDHIAEVERLIRKTLTAPQA